MAFLIAVILIISLVSITLSILSYNASYPNKADLKIQEVNLSDSDSEILVQFNMYKMAVEFMLKQINTTFLLLTSSQNATQLSMTQLRIDTNNFINQLMHNISNQLNTINEDIKSVASNVESNISETFIQLDTVRNDVKLVATSTEGNISQLFT